MLSTKHRQIGFSLKFQGTRTDKQKEKNDFTYNPFHIKHKMWCHEMHPYKLSCSEPPSDIHVNPTDRSNKPKVSVAKILYWISKT